MANFIQKVFGTHNDRVLKRILPLVERVNQLGVVARDLDGVIVVGGPTRLPLVRDAVREYFQQDVRTDVDPDQAVAMGAAIHAASLVQTDQEAYLLDVTPLSLRIGVVGGLAEGSKDLADARKQVLDGIAEILPAARAANMPLVVAVRF